MSAILPPLLFSVLSRPVCLITKSFAYFLASINCNFFCFIRLFLEKTGNDWTNREHFKKIAGKMSILVTDYSQKAEVSFVDFIFKGSGRSWRKFEKYLEAGNGHNYESFPPDTYCNIQFCTFHFQLRGVRFSLAEFYSKKRICTWLETKQEKSW